MSTHQPKIIWFRRLILILAAILGIGVLSYEIANQPGDNPQSGPPSVASVTIGGPFTLIDHHGRIRSDDDFRGRYMLVYFGYTYCPDICPFDLRKMTGALDRLGTRGAEIIPVFITIDPERDTAEHLAGYVEALDPRLVALTGSHQHIAQAAGNYRVYYAKAPPSEDADDDTYLMNHSALFYLMGPDGRYITHIPGGSSEEHMVTTLEQALDSPPPSS